MDQPLSPIEATERIRDIARFGTVTLSSHCWRDSMRKRGFDFQDLLRVLITGGVHEHPDLDPVTSEYKYKVEGYTLDDDNDAVTVITVILSHRELKAVTVF